VNGDKLMRALLLAASVLVLLWGCSFKPVEVALIKIKGSDSMLQLTETLAEEYMKLHPGISIYVYGGGTADGIRSLIRGDIDICTASRNLKPDEAKALAEYYGSVGLFYLIAKDALSIYTNKSNSINDISLDDLKKIFECKITKWSEVGGKHQKIIPVIRNLNSGTHLYFKDHVLEGDEYCNASIIKATTPEIIEYIEQNENAIGYGSMGYKGNIAYTKIDGIDPSEKNAQNDSYPLTRYFHFFTTQLPKGAVKNFVNWVLSPEGQRIVKQSGYIPLWDITF
jgi:phosphate transport system substrate-binding protein